MLLCPFIIHLLNKRFDQRAVGYAERKKEDDLLGGIIVLHDHSINRYRLGNVTNNTVVSVTIISVSQLPIAIVMQRVVVWDL